MTRGVVVMPPAGLIWGYIGLSVTRSAGGLALVFLVFRPQGLFGEKIIERV